jgi:hypothetical protein
MTAKRTVPDADAVRAGDFKGRRLGHSRAAPLPAQVVPRPYDFKSIKPTRGVTEIKFSLPLLTPLVNTMLRRNRWDRRKDARTIAWHVAAMTARQRPEKPFERARVTISRCSTGVPDPDGMVGGIKYLLDAFLPFSKTHPFGLGFVRDDSSACIGKPNVTAVRVPTRAEQRTDVLIEDLTMPTKTA